MLLAGDVGATKTNLAIFEAQRGLSPLMDETFRSASYPSLKAIVAEFLADAGVEVDAAVLGVPGPVVGGQSSITNLPWVVSESSLERELGLTEVRILNDLESTAYGLPQLGDEDLFPLNDAPPRSGTKAVVAPGTGLGEAVLVYFDGAYHAMPSEGGHTDFGPTNLFELEMLRYLMGRFGHISYERICSGRGIPLIYDYLKMNRFAPESAEVATAIEKADDPTPVIVQAALDHTCELSIATLNTFVSILGAEAGNLALKVMATGGVYLGGGIPPRIVSKLKDGTFMAAFVNKGRFDDVLAAMPVHVILNPRTALLGAAACGMGL
ncbi:MAG: glucokinase [Anaerolineae bacterium]|jgi:glucokinase